MEQSKVEMRSRGITCGSHISHYLSLAHILASPYSVSAQVSVESGISISNGDLYAVSVALVPRSHGHYAV